MTQAKHTPGPWIYHEVYFDQILGFDEAENAITKTVAFAHGYGVKEIAANASLIATAPELLDALKDALKVIECDESERLYGALPDKIRAAIAKAEGGAA